MSNNSSCRTDLPNITVWAVRCDPPDYLDDDLYERGLALVDEDSRARIQKFYRREDAWRCLVGRLLPRVLMLERQPTIDVQGIQFDFTSAKKPYFVHQPPNGPPIAFNISHDSGLVAMAFSEGPDLLGSPAFELGVDVMHVQLPRDIKLPEFVESIQDALTPFERRSLLGGSASRLPPRLPATIEFASAPPPMRTVVPPHVGLDRLFVIWTLKEAYTKALGQGMGFDFSRIEFSFGSGDLADGVGPGQDKSYLERENDTLRVDGQVPAGWVFILFQLPEQDGVDYARGTLAVAVRRNHYRGAIALHVGGDACRLTSITTAEARDSLVQFKQVRDMIELLEAKVV